MLIESRLQLALQDQILTLGWFPGVLESAHFRAQITGPLPFVCVDVESIRKDAAWLPRFAEAFGLGPGKITYSVDIRVGSRDDNTGKLAISPIDNGGLGDQEGYSRVLEYRVVINEDSKISKEGRPLKLCEMQNPHWHRDFMRVLKEWARNNARGR